MSPFQRIILFARQYRANQGVTETLQRLVQFLQSKQIDTVVDDETAHAFDLNLPVLARESMGEKHDLIVVVGGDGSLLSAARMAIHVDTPVVGINRGHLGFLTDISPHDFEQTLSAILQGEYIEEKRFLLTMRLYQNNIEISQVDALNDVVLSRGNETHLITFDVYIDGQFVSHYRSDGLILATPTGSTAYALSAGGPIMHPQINAVVMVPMFSHSLSSRPLVIGGDSEVELRICANNENALQISCDGHESHTIKANQLVKVKKHKQQLRLLHPANYHYYETLRVKLGWGTTHQG